MLSTSVLDCMGHGTEMRIYHEPPFSPDWGYLDPDQRTVEVPMEGIGSLYLAIKLLNFMCIQIMSRSVVYGDSQ